MCVCVCTIEQASIFKIISNMYYIHNPTYHPKAPLTSRPILNKRHMR